MLVSTGSDIVRVQCAFIDTPEIERVTDFIYKQKGYAEPYKLPLYSPEGDGGGKVVDLDQTDPMFDEVARFIVQNQQGSTSAVQRRFSIGYNRAGRIMDQIEAAGIVGKAEGSKPREVLISDMGSLEMLLRQMDL
jgi:S-DNA-T family DNA segregation ATPase FtsK/SpoIIIE